MLERPRALGEGTAGVEVPEARGCGSRGTVAVTNKQTNTTVLSLSVYSEDVGWTRDGLVNRIERRRSDHQNGVILSYLRAGSKSLRSHRW